jgi:hypothetical protein
MRLALDETAEAYMGIQKEGLVVCAIDLEENEDIIVYSSCS